VVLLERRIWRVGIQITTAAAALLVLAAAAEGVRLTVCVVFTGG
jgi:hypothetical protein